ncbi:MAG: undecaprenyl-phosphate glucose phosphotransferase [Chloroflexota bacterium]|nr:undecaprenyl-phosphate glucose phosphotransferase [Chloroflexota bacterium]
MSRRRVRLIFGTLLFLTDAAMMSLAFYLAYRLRLLTEYQQIFPFPYYLGMLFIQVATLLTLFFFAKLYHRQPALSRIDEIYTIFGNVSVGVIISFAIISFLYRHQLEYPRLMMLYSWLLTIILVILGRLGNQLLRIGLQSQGWGRIRVLIIGTGEVGQMILGKATRSPGMGYEVVGFVARDDQSRKQVHGVSVLGSTDDLPTIIEDYRVDEVIIALPDASHQEILNLISLCERERVSIKVFPDVFQIMAQEITIGDLNGLPMVTVQDIALRGWKLTLKRGIDLLGATVGLIFLSPLMMLVALLIKLDSAGSVFFCQERMGLDAKPFWTIKFRSMREDAETETGPVWARPGDPRRTRVGRFLRRFSIDELPQLINVLLGEMSLVGPRPERPVFVRQFQQFIPRYMDRHREKAGMTGWAQVNGLRGDTSIMERTKYDLWYIENWSLLLDIKILLRTVLAVFRAKDAY